MTLPDTPDESKTLELLTRVRGGDDGAWAELYAAYHDDLLFTIRQKLGSRLRSVLQSEDVLQSVALEAFRDLPKFEHRGAGSLRAFLHKLVLHKIHHRAAYFAAQKRGVAPVPLTPSVEQQIGDRELPRYHDAERFEQLERCLGLLSDDMRQAILLRRFEGLTNREAGERLGKSEEAFRKTYSRALAQLALRMKGLPPP